MGKGVTPELADSSQERLEGSWVALSSNMMGDQPFQRGMNKTFTLRALLFMCSVDFGLEILDEFAPLFELTLDVVFELLG